MNRISLSFFYGLGATLRPLHTLDGQSQLSEQFAVLYQAKNELADLLSTDWFFPAVKAAHTPGRKLLTALETTTSRNDFDKEVGILEAFNIKNSLADFETVLRSELVIADAYFVTRKGGLDTSILVSSAEQNFPIALGVKVPPAIVDVREAGKCLAFELPTAAGFHIFRAVESVVRAYWRVVSVDKPAPKQRSLGAYTTAMAKEDVGSKKVRAVLTQLKDLHRNPLVHPQTTVSLEEAISLLGYVKAL